MKLIFFIKEGILGFKRARIAVTVSILTIGLSLSLIGGFGIFAQNLSDLFKQYYKKAVIEVFVNPLLKLDQIDQLTKNIRQSAAVESARYISPEEALRNFEKDFGADLVTVLDENPIPPSIRVTLNADASSLESTDAIVENIKKMEGIDDVVYQREILKIINEYFVIGILISVTLGLVIFVIATLLIFNSIRLTIYARRTIIEIMKLVGATNYFIKGPFMMEGILQGMIGGGFACLLMWFFGSLVKNLLEANLIIPIYFYFSLLGIGIFLGFLGSYFSVNKYLRY
jgi:cell division transport system permease protein